jgi:arylsulfatase A-like enzyme
VAPPKSPQEGYHLTTDLTDKAIEFIQDAKAIAPEKPFFLYFCPGAAHAPHHIFREWADRYRGQFDMGYEAIRETILARQKAMGIVPDTTELSPINPYADETGPDGQEWPDLDTVRPWDSLSGDEKRLFARMAEVYAGFLSHADHEIGRLVSYLEQTGQLDNTIVVVVSDNGASGEGGPNGSVNENKFFNGMSDSIEDNLKLLDELGGTRTYNHYPTGWAWAFNTPFKMWKRYGNLRGGTADPLIVSWPAGIQARGGFRRQYCHAVDIVPTLYEALGIELPDVVNGYPQKPLEGVSFAASFDDPSADTGKQTQFYSMLGTRALWHQGWKASSLGPAAPNAWGHFSGQRWELFNTDRDPSECHDLAGQEPDRLRQLIDMWWVEAGRYQALPLETRNAVEAFTTPRPELSKPRTRYLPARRRRGARVAGAEHPRPGVHDRRRGGDRLRGRGRGAVLPGLAIRGPGPLRQGRQARLRLQLRRRGRAGGRVRPASPDRSCGPVGVLRAGSRQHAPAGDAEAAYQGSGGGRGQDRDPAREVQARRRRPGRRALRSRAGRRRLSRPAPLGFHRRHDQTRDHRRQRAALRRPGERGGGRLRPPMRLAGE